MSVLENIFSYVLHKHSQQKQNMTIVLQKPMPYMVPILSFQPPRFLEVEEHLVPLQ
jgi:hypothetical protein